MLYAPNVKFNLFSVSQAADDLYKVTFEKSGKCCLKYANSCTIAASTTSTSDLCQFVANTNKQELAHAATPGTRPFKEWTCGPWTPAA
ncbi:hypothetical protein FI667_g16145, partial [Globisporangium splendens]